MPGYPLELFLEEPSELYICGICHDILKEPKQCLQGHAYCNDCIHTHMAQSRSCPMCACPLGDATLARCLALRDLLGRMQIKCPMTLQVQPQYRTGPIETQEASCTWTGILDTVEDHVIAHCPCTEFSCPNDGCDRLIQRRHLPLHYDNCIYQLVKCPHCMEILKRMKFQRHGEICPMKPRTYRSYGRFERYTLCCPLGCHASMPRKESELHFRTNCPLYPVGCPHLGCGERGER